MNRLRFLFLLVSHTIIGAIGFAAGIYALPILIAPPSPKTTDVEQHAKTAMYVGAFEKDLEDSDALHWGEGNVFVANDSVSFLGELAPGPDYRLYLSREFVETEEKFNALKATMREVGQINTFENFIVPLPTDIDPSKFNTVIVWCENFGQFITAAKYQ